MIPDPDIAREVTAPVSGVVTAVSISTDALNNAAEPCVVISSSERMQVKIAIPEEYLRRIEIGQRVLVSGNALAKEKLCLAPSAKSMRPPISRYPAHCPGRWWTRS